MILGLMDCYLSSSQWANLILGLGIGVSGSAFRLGFQRPPSESSTRPKERRPAAWVDLRQEGVLNPEGRFDCSF